MPEWKKFEDKSGYSGKPTITIRKTGSFGISSHVMKKYFEDIDWVDLYYNEGENLIGFKGRDDRGENSYTLNRVQNSESGIVTSSSFLNKHEIDTEETRKYIAKYDEENDIVYIDLDEEPIG